MKKTLIAAIALAASASSFAATPPSMSVVYSKADLTSERGREAVYEDLKHAARTLCGPTQIGLAGTFQQARENKTCFEGTLSAAVERIGNDALTSRHEG